ncbi:MAG: tyrosine recombinase [Rickettsiales bacterium]|nr:tyrosine recombinase [Rickettsiales bacterium]
MTLDKNNKFFNPLIRNFLDKITAEDGLSQNTILSYGKDLELFYNFIKNKNNGKDVELQNISSDDIKNYFYELYNQNLRASSVSRKISVLKNFYGFLESENLIKINPTLYLQGQKRERSLPKFLSEEEIFKLFNCANHDKSEFGIKLSCMLEIMYSAGLRVSELVSLPINSIQEINENNQKTLRNYLIVKGKGNKERIAALNKSAIAMLIKYLELRKKLGLEKSQWLFVGTIRASKKVGKIRQHNIKVADFHITRQRFHQMLKELAVKAGIDSSRVHPHVIRHSFATHLLNNGVDLRVLQELLGHSNISTTEIYTHILDSKLREVVFKFHPLADNNFVKKSA